MSLSYVCSQFGDCVMSFAHRFSNISQFFTLFYKKMLLQKFCTAKKNRSVCHEQKNFISKHCATSRRTYPKLSLDSYLCNDWLLSYTVRNADENIVVNSLSVLYSLVVNSLSTHCQSYIPE